MKLLFELKAWQAFIVLIFCVVLSITATILNLSIGSFSAFEMSRLFGIAGILIFTLWLFLVGIGLNRIENNPHKFSNVLLGIAAICFFVGYASMPLSQFEGLENLIPFKLQILTPLITFLGLGYLFYNIPMSLKSAELGEKAKFSNCILDALLFFSCAMGIGIWWLQSRMKKVA